MVMTVWTCAVLLLAVALMLNTPEYRAAFGDAVRELKQWLNNIRSGKH